MRIDRLSRIVTGVFGQLMSVCGLLLSYEIGSGKFMLISTVYVHL